MPLRDVRVRPPPPLPPPPCALAVVHAPPVGLLFRQFMVVPLRFHWWHPVRFGSVRCTRRPLQFATFASGLCKQIRDAGYWADYIDPCSGLPVSGVAGRPRDRSNGPYCPHFSFLRIVPVAPVVPCLGATGSG